MNISPLTIYLWQMADRIQSSSLAATILAAVVGGILLLAKAAMASSPQDGTPESRAYIAGKGRFLLILAAILGTFSTLTPSSNTIAMMVVIPEIAHSKVVQQDLPDIYNAAVKALKDQLSK